MACCKSKVNKYGAPELGLVLVLSEAEDASLHGESGALWLDEEILSGTGYPESQGWYKLIRSGGGKSRSVQIPEARGGKHQMKSGDMSRAPFEAAELMAKGNSNSRLMVWIHGAR